MLFMLIPHFLLHKVNNIVAINLIAGELNSIFFMGCYLANAQLNVGKVLSIGLPLLHSHHESSCSSGSSFCTNRSLIAIIWGMWCSHPFVARIGRPTHDVLAEMI